MYYHLFSQLAMARGGHVSCTRIGYLGIVGNIQVSLSLSECTARGFSTSSLGMY